MAAALWLFWEMHGHLQEGLGWLSGALAGTTDEDARRSAATCAERVIPSDRRAPDRIHAVASARAQALIGVGHLSRRLGDVRRAAEVAEQSLALCRELANDQAVAYASCSLAILAACQGQHARAVALNEAGLALFREARDTRGTAAALQNLAGLAQAQAEYDRAALLFQQSLALFNECHDKPCSADVLASLGTVAELRGDHTAAQSHYKASLALREEIGTRQGVAALMERLERVA